VRFRAAGGMSADKPGDHYHQASDALIPVISVVVIFEIIVVIVSSGIIFAVVVIIATIRNDILRQLDRKHNDNKDENETQGRVQGEFDQPPEAFREAPAHGTGRTVGGIFRGPVDDGSARARTGHVVGMLVGDRGGERGKGGRTPLPG